jgi:hypothetical protein
MHEDHSNSTVIRDSLFELTFEYQMPNYRRFSTDIYGKYFPEQQFPRIFYASKIDGNLS